MTTLAGIGMGTTLAIGDGTTPTEVFTALGEMTAFAPPEATRDSIDATHMLSPGRHREFIPGLWDAGEVSITLNFTEAGWTALAAAKAKTAASNWKATYPLIGAQTTTGSTLLFAGFLTSVTKTDPMDGKREITCKVKVSGQPTYTAGS